MPANNNSQGSGAGSGSVLQYPTPKKPWENAGNVWSDHDIAGWFHAEGFANDYCYVPQLKLWRRYDGARWVHDYVHLDAAVLAFMASIRHHCKKPKDREKLGSAGKIASVKKILQTLHWRDDDQWDADPWLLNCPGGTFELELLAMVMRGHRREDYITKITRANPSGQCPNWQSHIAFITENDQQLAFYHQYLAGYMLVGDSREQMFAFFHGGGGNGKSVYIDSILHVLGDYATTIAPSAFTEQRFGLTKHEEELMCMRGARLIVSSEIARGSKWNEARLKAVTGGDYIVASYKGKDSVRFKVGGTLIITGNNKPSFHVDNAIRRRMHLVPFDAKVEDADIDKQLPDTLKLEAGGILQWMIDGCERWQQDGRLCVCDKIIVATAEYIAEEDHVRQWLDDKCNAHVKATIEMPRTALFTSWKEWCDDNNLPHGTPNNFYNQLKSLGYKQKRSNRERYFVGISLEI